MIDFRAVICDEDQKGEEINTRGREGSWRQYDPQKC